MTWHAFILILLLNSSLAYSQKRFDIIIDEIMADPSPSVGMPNYEWIELKNISGNPINLHNWRIGDANGISGNFPSFLLQPDSFIIICSNSAYAAMAVWGTTLAIPGFPSLDNESELVYLRAPGGQSIHAIEYVSDWYQNEIKKEGGWSLEMIDTNLPCTGSTNWTAAINGLGASPGKKNSVLSHREDLDAPLLLRSFCPDSNTVVLVFNEPLDSANAVILSAFAINGGIRILQATCLPPLFTEVLLHTDRLLDSDFVYSVSVTNVKDCNNNMETSVQSARTGFSVEPEPGDWIINEILFNPRPNGYDFVECYNKSRKILDASKLRIGNRSMRSSEIPSRFVSRGKCHLSE